MYLKSFDSYQESMSYTFELLCLSKWIRFNGTVFVEQLYEPCTNNGLCCQSALAEPGSALCPVPCVLCWAVWAHRLGSRGGRAADLCRSGLGYSECPWETSCVQYLASENSGSQRSPPCHQNNPEYYHQHQIAYSQEIFLSSWVTGLAVAGLPHLEDPKWKTRYLIIYSVSFSAEKNRRMCLEMLWIGFLQGIYFCISLFFSFRFIPMYYDLLEEKNKKYCKRPNHSCALNSSNYIAFWGWVPRPHTSDTQNWLTVASVSLLIPSSTDIFYENWKLLMFPMTKVENFSKLRFGLFILACYEIKMNMETEEYHQGKPAEFCFLCFNITH